MVDFDETLKQEEEVVELTEEQEMAALEGFSLTAEDVLYDRGLHILENKLEESFSSELAKKIAAGSCIVCTGCGKCKIETPEGSYEADPLEVVKILVERGYEEDFASRFVAGDPTAIQYFKALAEYVGTKDPSGSPRILSDQHANNPISDKHPIPEVIALIEARKQSTNSEPQVTPNPTQATTQATQQTTPQTAQNINQHKHFVHQPHAEAPKVISQERLNAKLEQQAPSFKNVTALVNKDLPNENLQQRQSREQEKPQEKTFNSREVAKDVIVEAKKLIETLKILEPQAAKVIRDLPDSGQSPKQEVNQTVNHSVNQNNQTRPEAQTNQATRLSPHIIQDIKVIAKEVPLFVAKLEAYLRVVTPQAATNSNSTVSLPSALRSAARELNQVSQALAQTKTLAPQQVRVLMGIASGSLAKLIVDLRQVVKGSVNIQSQGFPLTVAPASVNTRQGFAPKPRYQSSETFQRRVELRGNPKNPKMKARQELSQLPRQRITKPTKITKYFTRPVSASRAKISSQKRVPSIAPVDNPRRVQVVNSSKRNAVFSKSTLGKLRLNKEQPRLVVRGNVDKNQRQNPTSARLKRILNLVTRRSLPDRKRPESRKSGTLPRLKSTSTKKLVVKSQRLNLRPKIRPEGKTSVKQNYKTKLERRLKLSRDRKNTTSNRVKSSQKVRQKMITVSRLHKARALSSRLIQKRKLQIQTVHSRDRKIVKLKPTINKTLRLERVRLNKTRRESTVRSSRARKNRDIALVERTQKRRINIMRDKSLLKNLEMRKISRNVALKKSRNTEIYIFEELLAGLRKKTKESDRLRKKLRKLARQKKTLLDGQSTDQSMQTQSGRLAVKRKLRRAKASIKDKKLPKTPVEDLAENAQQESFLKIHTFKQDDSVLQEQV